MKYDPADSAASITVDVDEQEEARTSLFLRVQTSTSKQRLYPLTRGAHVVGRARGSHIRLRCPAVSRRHAVIEVTAAGVVEITDAGARNPVLVNGAAARRRRLRAGDRIRLGNVAIDLLEVSPPALSSRELEVALLVAEGLTNREIAERLFVSPRTVSTHLSNVYRRLAIPSRAGLVGYISTLI